MKTNLELIRELHRQYREEDADIAAAISLSSCKGETSMYESTDPKVSGYLRRQPDDNSDGAMAAGDNSVDQAISLLRRKVGVRLPAGTNAKNFTERLTISLMQLPDGGGSQDDDDKATSMYGERGPTPVDHLEMSAMAAGREEEEDDVREDLDKLEASIMALVARLEMPISLIADELGMSTEIDTPPRRRQRLLKQAMSKVEKYQDELEEFKRQAPGNLGLAGGLARGGSR